MAKDSRPIVSQEDISDAIGDLKCMVKQKAKKHGPRVYLTPHNALGIITEEYWELIEAIKSNDPNRIYSEIMDVAVACIWQAASTYTYERQEEKTNVNR